MAIKELNGSPTGVIQTDTGATATRRFKVTYATRISESPAIGDLFPGNDYKGLKVISRAFSPLGDDNAHPDDDGNGFEYATVTVEYSTEYFLANTIEIDFSVEAINTAESRTYADTNTPVIGSSAIVYYPVASITVNKRIFGDPFIPISIVMIMSGGINQGRVKLGAFDVLPEYLLFEGATSKSYKLMNGTVQTDFVYKFTYRNRSHNEVWRPGLVARNKNGKIQYNADGTVQMMATAPGTGKWTRVTPAIYQSYNFGKLL